MFPATMIHRSGAARVRVNSQEDLARLGSHWQLETQPEPPVAVVEAVPEPEPAAAPVIALPKRGRPRKGA